MLKPIFYVLTVITVKVSAQIDAGPAIYDKVFANYNKNIRPKRNVSDFITIEINPVLVSVESVNERRELITLYYWFNMKWIDEYLQWNETEMGVDMIHVPARVLWLPDIAVDSIIKLSDIPDSDDVYCRMFSTGQIYCLYNQVVEVHCAMKVAKFPFDQQNCTIIYYSWFHNAFQIRLTTPSLNGTLGFYKNNTEWDLLEFTNLVFLHHYVSGVYSEVHYYIVLRRKPIYYIFTLVLPIFLLTTISLVGLFSPNKANEEREEEVSMGLTALLTMAVLLLVIAEQMPKTSDGLPMLGKYLLFQMVLTSIGTLFTVWIMSLNKRAVDRKPIPKWLLRITFLYPEKVDRACSAMSRHEYRDLIKDLLVGPTKPMTPLPLLLNQCTEHLIAVRKLLEERKINDDSMKAWNKACGRLDTIFMIIFMALNIIATFAFFFTGIF